MKNTKQATRYLIALGALFVPFLYLFFTTYQPKIEPKKKKIIVFTSPGGGGHISASKALTHYLSPKYEVTSDYLLENVLKAIDPVQTCTFGHFSGEQLYNKLLYGQHFGLINFIHSFGPWVLNLNAEKAQQCLLDYLKQKKPDIVISVMPIFNHMLLRATRKLSIPFLVTAVDMDINTYLENLEVTPSDQFYLNLAYDDKEMRQLAFEKGVESDKLSAYGMPLRPSFFKEYDRQQVRKQFNIPKDKPVVLVILGAQGSKQTYLIARQLRKVQHPLHAIFCVGRNGTLKDHINDIKYPEHVSITVLGFTDEIAALMASSDMLIAKGGTTMFEALHSKLPMLLDATSTILKWEYFVHNFVHKNQCGDSIKTMRSLSPVINELLVCPKKLDGYRYGLSSIITQNAGEKIAELVDDILQV